MIITEVKDMSKKYVREIGISIVFNVIAITLFIAWWISDNQTFSNPLAVFQVVTFIFGLFFLVKGIKDINQK